jgi:hypothetical protein
MKFRQEDIQRFWAKVRIVSPLYCWEWQAALLTNGGYGAFRLGGKTYRAHRIAYFLTTGDLDPDLELLHRCNNKKCCNPCHLLQGTHGQNLAQAGAEGKMTRHLGANSKLNFTQEQLLHILTASCSARELARLYNVDHKTIRSIQKEYQVCPTTSQ